MNEGNGIGINFGKHNRICLDPNAADGPLFGKRTEFFAKGYYENYIFIGPITISFGGYTMKPHRNKVGESPWSKIEGPPANIPESVCECDTPDTEEAYPKCRSGYACRRCLRFIVGSTSA